jgi:predicted dehydrogenase
MTVGVIGCCGIARSNMNASKPWLAIVAIKDVNKGRRKHFNDKFADGKAAQIEDYHEVMVGEDVDVIHVAAPDHWNTKPLVEAMLAGKDVNCEKPLTLTIGEGKLIRKVQRETGRVVQVDMMQRSQFEIVAGEQLGHFATIPLLKGDVKMSIELVLKDKAIGPHQVVIGRQ